MTVVVIHIHNDDYHDDDVLCAYNNNNLSTAGSLREERGRGHYEGPDRYDLMMMMEDRWRDGQSE